MAKPADLRQAMSAGAKARSRISTTPLQSVPVIQTTNPGTVGAGKTETRPEDNPYYRPGRVAKSTSPAIFPQAVKKQLRMLAAEREMTIQRLLAEALNGLLR